mmetsp:Transcript_6381/g.14209  ORF Transcript_6381/g.14209 Transcript_6381/m.14209 type:complete len:897 (-) Transcript_6381:120-2810(-)
MWKGDRKAIESVQALEPRGNKPRRGCDRKESSGDHLYSLIMDSAEAPSAPLLDEGAEEGILQRHDVSDAVYPLPEPLVRRLRGGVLLEAPTETAQTKQPVVKRESTDQALEQLVGNSIEAVDAMYFAAPPKLRKHPAFQHRLCFRVRADTDSKTLSITDLGAGMTRSDLINSLGIGRAGLMSKSGPNRKNGKDKPEDGEDPLDTTDEEEFDDDEDDETEEGDEEMEGDDDNEEETEDEENNTANEETEDPILEEEIYDCRTSEVGGFYAALVSLGTGIKVSTKSKFDDLYEFSVGLLADGDDPKTAFDSFRIRRPKEEGSKLTVEDGYDQFQDVRGDSGTCITIRLNEAAVAEGLLDEAKLKEIFLVLLETTQYTVAFSKDGQAEEIIQASAKEQEALAELEMPKKDVDALEAVADIELGSEKQEDDTSRSYNSVKERAKYIPLRLSLSQRKMLRLVEATMTCCDYTTSVDRPFKTAVRRTHEQLRGITSVLRGLVTACDYKAGQKLLSDEDYSEYDHFFRQMFEIARRHKIMNPEKMRTEYGKLIYLLQDAVSPSISPHLGFSVKGPIESVYKFLEEKDGLDLLSDKLIETATEEILALRKTRAVIDREIKQKERAVAVLKKKYATRKLTPDEIHNCLYSICDNNSFLNSNRVPIDKIIDYLTTHFSADRIEERYSLSIVSGEDGARLSHSHERQYYFALQSLTLWRDIIDDMFRLWAMAEEDLLSESVTYSLQDTGQGMQRVQQCPRTYKAMQKILTRVQSKVNHWVGSSVIHMRGHNVPNALSFIDKYTQVPRILNPIVSCLENLEKICEKDEGIRQMVDDGFGGLEKVRKDILYDFFKSAFDGSGADNFYDAGSCIDGRMTSAWNWCSQLQEKPFYPIFKLTGFVGFDGEFK